MRGQWFKPKTILYGLLACLGLLFGLGLIFGKPQENLVSAAPRGGHWTQIGNLQQPVGVYAAPGDPKRLFVLQQTGQIRVRVDGHWQAGPFLDLSRQVSCCGEQGLLGLAFAPDYARSHRFYVYYTNRSGDSRIVEYHTSQNPSRADAASARIVLAQDQPQANHNGGNIAFGPDGFLYIGLGDGGGQGDPHGLHGNAQNLASLLGKILRIDPRARSGRPYSIPRDNPFVGRPGARAEIWSYGLRNPWRFSFDRLRGGLIIGDVGANQIEEIDWAPPPARGRGVNYGWRVWEGTRRNRQDETAALASWPAAQYAHDQGRCSVTGGFVVRDKRLPNLYGRYLFADFCSGEIWQAALRPGRLAAGVSLLSWRINAPSSFGQDGQGRIYLTSLQGGVYRLDP